MLELGAKVVDGRHQHRPLFRQAVERDASMLQQDERARVRTVLGRRHVSMKMTNFLEPSAVVGERPRFVCAQECDRQLSQECAPKLLELYGGGLEPVSAEQVDHLAESSQRWAR